MALELEGGKMEVRLRNGQSRARAVLALSAPGKDCWRHVG